MNFLRVWPGSIRSIKKKRVRPKSTFKSALEPVPSEAPTTQNAIDEIRRQAVTMSSFGPKLTTPPVTAKLVKRKQPHKKTLSTHAAP
jgi:hypothetical protein